MATKAKKVQRKKVGSAPKAIILGRGVLRGRKLYGIRLPESTIFRLRSLIKGPDYLALQIAIERYCDDLEKADGIEVISAADLG